MTLIELIEQLELIKYDHPEAASLEVRAADLATFTVNYLPDGCEIDSEPRVEIELYRPWALGK
jgi:hypothetical protein